MDAGMRLAGIAIAIALTSNRALAQTTTLVSRASGGSGAQGNYGSFYPSISADGRYVAFESASTTLPLGGGILPDQIFVRDLLGATTILASRANGSSGARGNHGSYYPSISANGHYVAFGSDATNLVPGDANSTEDVFVRSLQNATTTLVSRANGVAGAQGNQGSYRPSISADGHHVAFSSDATNFVPGDANATEDVFIRDLPNATTALVSCASGVSGAQGNQRSYHPSISADGRYVAFESSASNLVPDDANGFPDVFVRDLETGATVLASRASGHSGTRGNSASGEPSISADGRYVAFRSEAGNLVTGDTNNYTDVFVRDLLTDSTELVSANSYGVPGNSSSFQPSISADGRFVAFASYSTNLVVINLDGSIEVVVSDRYMDTVELVSAGSSGLGGTASSNRPAISADGRDVAFDSDSPDHVLGDTNGASDVFLRDRSSNPGDFVFDTGYVYLGYDTIPLNNVSVQVFDDPTQPPIATATTTGDGRYCFQGITGSHRIKAILEYDEPGTSPPKRHMIAAYPSGGPDTVVAFGTGLDGRLPDVIFEHPIVLQAGWRGLGGELPFPAPANSSEGSGGGIKTWDYAVGEQCMPPEPCCGESCGEGFLTADPGNPSALHYQYKHDNRIPAFLCFRVPRLNEHADGYDPRATSSHDANGRTLARWIREKVRRTLTETPSAAAPYVDPDHIDRVRFSIICHSMGGVITRAMLVHAPEVPVHRIVSLDGIHGGSEWAANHTTWNFTERNMNGWDAPAPNEPPAHDGWNTEATSDLSHSNRWLLYSCIDATTFGAIQPEESALGFGRIFLRLAADTAGLSEPFWSNEWLRGTRIRVDEGHGAIYGTQSRMAEAAGFLLGPAFDEQTLTNLLRSRRPESVGALFGLLSAPPNSTATVAIPIDANGRARCRFIRSGAGAEYALKDQNGLPIPIQSYTTSELDPTSWVDGFVIQSPPVGNATLELTAAFDPAVVAWSFALNNGRRLVVNVLPASVQQGQLVQVTASLREVSDAVIHGSGTICAMAARLPDGSTLPITMFDDGQHGDAGAADGVFGGEFTAPSAGRHGMEGMLATTLGSETVTRTGTDTFTVLPVGLSFIGIPGEITPDANGDGKLDALVVTQSIGLTSTRSVAVTGKLVDAQGDVIYLARAELIQPPSAGTYPLELRIPGAEIVRNGEDGPWTLTNLILYDLDAGFLPGATAADFNTQAWSASTFEPPPWPGISHFAPDSGPSSGGNHVILHGSFLQDTTSITLDGQQAIFAVTGDTTIDVTVPHRSASGAGGLVHQLADSLVNVRVTTPWGVAVASSAYTYRRMLPH